MHYPVAIEWGDENTATGMVFPDILGAISAGDTPEEAYNNAIEAAHIVLEDLKVFSFIMHLRIHQGRQALQLILR